MRLCDNFARFRHLRQLCFCSRCNSLASLNPWSGVLVACINHNCFFSYYTSIILNDSLLYQTKKTTWYSFTSAGPRIDKIDSQRCSTWLMNWLHTTGTSKRPRFGSANRPGKMGNETRWEAGKKGHGIHRLPGSCFFGFGWESVEMSLKL